jgi:hypothetical protein
LLKALVRQHRHRFSRLEIEASPAVDHRLLALKQANDIVALQCGEQGCPLESRRKVSPFMQNALKYYLRAF